MTKYQPKVGDRVRLTFEAVVEPAYYRFINGTRTTDMWMRSSADISVVSIEKIQPPLPTTPGSVVRCWSIGGLRSYYRFRSNRGWVDEEGCMFSFDSTVHYEVIFDAGRVS